MVGTGRVGFVGLGHVEVEGRDVCGVGGAIPEGCSGFNTGLRRAASPWGGGREDSKLKPMREGFQLNSRALSCQPHQTS